MIDAIRDDDLHELVEEASHLVPEDRQILIEHARRLRSQRLPRPSTFRDLKPFFGVLDPKSADEIEAAIEEGCERIDHESW
jgi:hypothetical protein